MDEHSPNSSQLVEPEADAQPLALQHLLKSLNSARRQCSLYGSDHPSTQEAVTGLMEIIKDFLECFGPSTLVMAEEAVILNDRWYKPCVESIELFHRLRSRGAMAISIVDDPGSDQAIKFLTYLNAEPRDIRRRGSSSAYLRKHGVTRIAVTDTIFASGDDEEQISDEEARDRPSVDRAVAAAVAWLTKQDEDDESPRFRTSEILSNPDAAAKLILEAVTKLHASHRSKRPSELSAQVVNDLKDLASTDHREWDNATPQVRKALSKLPREVRPSLGGFAACDQDVDIDGSRAVTRAGADASEVEAAISTYLQTAVANGMSEVEMAPPVVERLFGAASSGLLSNWKDELQPKTAIRSSTQTLSMLLSWETNPTEHGHIARALAALIPQSIDMGEMRLALEAASSLVNQLTQSNQPWRSVNARIALQTVDVAILEEMIEHAFKAENQLAGDVAASLVETLPSLTLAVIETAIGCGDPHFQNSLRAGIEKTGRSAAPVLGKLVMEGPPATRWAALEMLIALQTDWALLQIESALLHADQMFLAKALDALCQAQSPVAIRICTENLKHKSSVVRCAALRGLGLVGNKSVLPLLILHATRRAFRSYHLNEQVAAITAIGKLGGPDMIESLSRIATSRSLFWRSRYEQVRSAAAEAVEEIRLRCNDEPGKAA